MTADPSCLKHYRKFVIFDEDFKIPRPSGKDYENLKDHSLKLGLVDYYDAKKKHNIQKCGQFASWFENWLIEKINHLKTIVDFNNKDDVYTFVNDMITTWCSITIDMLSNREKYCPSNAHTSSISCCKFNLLETKQWDDKIRKHFDSNTFFQKAVLYAYAYEISDVIKNGTHFSVLSNIFLQGKSTSEGMNIALGNFFENYAQKMGNNAFSDVMNYIDSLNDNQLLDSINTISDIVKKFNYHKLEEKFQKRSIALSKRIKEVNENSSLKISLNKIMPYLNGYDERLQRRGSTTNKIKSQIKLNTSKSQETKINIDGSIINISNDCFRGINLQLSNFNSDLITLSEESLKEKEIEGKIIYPKEIKYDNKKIKNNYCEVEIYLPSETKPIYFDKLLPIRYEVNAEKTNLIFYIANIEPTKKDNLELLKNYTKEHFSI